MQDLVDELCTAYDCLCPLNKATLNENKVKVKKYKVKKR